MKKLCKDIFWIITISTFVIIATYSLLKIFDKEFKMAIYIEISIAIIIACFRIFCKKNTDVFNKIFYRDYKYKKEYNDKEIRLSFAYWIRISINGKYLLIKSKRDKYQPVGGVYHIDDKVKINDKFGFYRDSHLGDANYSTWDIAKDVGLSMLVAGITYGLTYGIGNNIKGNNYFKTYSDLSYLFAHGLTEGVKKEVVKQFMYQYTIMTINNGLISSISEYLVGYKWKQKVIEGV